MTRLFDAPHGKIHEFEKRLQAAGFTAEHLQSLLADDSRLRAWVAKVDEKVVPEPPLDRVFLSDAFSSKGRAFSRLETMKFEYLDEVAECTASELLDVRNLGTTMLRQIVEVLEVHGLSLAKRSAGPPAVVHIGHYVAYYRLRAGSAYVRHIPTLGYGDYVSDRAPDCDIDQFKAMGSDERELILTPGGIRKIERFITANHL